MTRWQPGAEGRLKDAALELFTEKGFAETTVPEIAARAGLTTRTFFRHFADKREVLFDGDEIPRFARDLMARAPLSVDPWTLIIDGLRTTAEARFEGRRDYVRQWRTIVLSDDGLFERDLLKRAAICAAVREGFLQRGLESTTAAMIAETATAVLFVSIERWLELDDDQTLFELIMDTLQSMHSSIGSLGELLVQRRSSGVSVGPDLF